MSRPQIKIHNIETDEIIVRDMNDEELVAYEKIQQDELDRIEEAKKAKKAKEALLERLGITEEEAKLLLS